MKVKELKELLNNYPDYLEIWVSDGGNSEGGRRLTKVEKVLAVDAGLDGDEVDDEYFYIDEDTDVISLALGNEYSLCKEGDAVSKEILYLND